MTVGEYLHAQSSRALNAQSSGRRRVGGNYLVAALRACPLRDTAIRCSRRRPGARRWTGVAAWQARDGGSSRATLGSSRHQVDGIGTLSFRADSATAALVVGRFFRGGALSRRWCRLHRRRWRCGRFGQRRGSRGRRLGHRLWSSSYLGRRRRSNGWLGDDRWWRRCRSRSDSRRRGRGRLARCGFRWMLHEFVANQHEVHGLDGRMRPRPRVRLQSPAQRDVDQPGDGEGDTPRIDGPAWWHADTPAPHRGA